MAFGMNDILDAQFLSAAYTKVASATVRNPLLDFFDVPQTQQNMDGPEVEVTIYPAQNEPAPLNAPGAPARTINTQGAEKKFITPMHTFNEQVIPWLPLSFLPYYHLSRNRRRCDAS